MQPPLGGAGQDAAAADALPTIYNIIALIEYRRKSLKRSLSVNQKPSLNIPRLFFVVVSCSDIVDQTKEHLF